MQNEPAAQNGEQSLRISATIMPELRDEPNVYTFSADGSKLTAYDIFPPDLRRTVSKNSK